MPGPQTPAWGSPGYVAIGHIHPDGRMQHQLVCEDHSVCRFEWNGPLAIDPAERDAEISEIMKVHRMVAHEQG